DAGDWKLPIRSIFPLAPICLIRPLGPIPPMKPLIIAIDGPSGAGKGTVARAVAAELGYRHVDSGAMYRAVGWKALREGVPLDDEPAVAALSRRSDIAANEIRVTIHGNALPRAPAQFGGGRPPERRRRCPVCRRGARSSSTFSAGAERMAAS